MVSFCRTFRRYVLLGEASAANTERAPVGRGPGPDGRARASAQYCSYGRVAGSTGRFRDAGLRRHAVRLLPVLPVSELRSYYPYYGAPLNGGFGGYGGTGANSVGGPGTYPYYPFSGSGYYPYPAGSASAVRPHTRS